MAPCAPPGGRRPLLAAAAVIALAAPSAAGERPWLEVKTPHFVVVANTSERSARDVGGQFEQVRYVFETLWPWARRGGGRPLVVIALRDESDMKALAPQYWERGHDGVAGVTVSGADKDYVALQAGGALPDDLRTNPYYFAYWGYADSVLRAVFQARTRPSSTASRSCSGTGDRRRPHSARASSTSPPSRRASGSTSAARCTRTRRSRATST